MRAGPMTRHTRKAHRLRAVLVLGCACAGLLAVAPAAFAKVLRVGTFSGKPGPYQTITRAVAKAKPGDWILIAPGDYKEASTTFAPGARGAGAGVLVQKSGDPILGIDRNGDKIDGT